eukprot:gene8829-6359_t
MYREDAYHYSLPRRKAIDDDDTRSYNRAVRQRYERVERLIQQRLLKDPNGVVVSNRPLYNAYTFRFRSFVGDLQLLAPEIPPASWFKRRAACIFALFLFDASQRQQKRALTHWRSIVSDERRIKHRFFDKWSVHAARRRLATLNARRFVTLTQPLVRKVVAAHLRCTWQTWQHFVEWRRLFVRIRLLFRCWKTVVHALRTRRRRLVQRGFDDWRQFQRHQQAALLDRLAAVHTRRLARTWRSWRAAWTRRRAVHRLVACMTRFCALPWLQLYVAWNRWRHHGRRAAPPALLSPHARTTSPRPLRSPASPPPSSSSSPLRRSGESPAPRRRHAANCIACAASYASSVSLSASSAFAALRGGTRSETKPPPPPPPLAPQQAASLREKIRWRLERVKEADARFAANEDSWKEQHGAARTPRPSPSPSPSSSSRLATPAASTATRHDNGDEGDAEAALRRVLLAEFAEYLPADFAAAGPVGYFDDADDAADDRRRALGDGAATWAQLLRPSVDDEEDDASAAVAPTPVAQLFPASTTRRPRAARDDDDRDDDRDRDEGRRFHATAPQPSASSSSVGRRYAPRHRRDASSSASRSTSPSTTAAAAAAAPWDEVYAPRLATSLTRLPMPQRSPSPTTPSPPTARAPRGTRHARHPPQQPQPQRGPRDTRDTRDTRSQRDTPATAAAAAVGRPSSGSRRR